MAQRREQKKEHTRRVLEETGLRLFQERGFDATTIDEIAEAALVSPRTFFRYFASKEDVVFSYLEDLYDQINAELVARPPDEDPMTALAVTMVSAAERFETQADEIRRRSRLAAYSEALASRALLLKGRWQEGLAQALANRLGDERPTLAIRVQVGAALETLSAAIHYWQRDGSDNRSLAELTKQGLYALSMPVPGGRAA